MHKRTNNSSIEPLYRADDLQREACKQMAIGANDKAEKCLRDAIEIRKGVAAGTEVEAMRDLGFFLMHRARYQEAIAEFETAIRIIERVRYPKHPLTAPLLDAIAICHVRQEQWEAAEQVTRQSLEIKQACLLPQDTDNLETMRTLAEILRMQGKYDEATTLLKKAMTTVEPSTSGPIEEFEYELALVYQDSGKTADAMAMYRKLLPIFARRHGKNRRYGDVLSNLATLLRSQERTAEAQRLEEEARELIADHRDILRQNTPGPLYFERGLYPATILH